MRGFKAKALRRLAKQIMGESDPVYMAEPYKGQPGPTHTRFTTGVGPHEVPNTVVRTDKAYRLYKKMKGELR